MQRFAKRYPEERKRAILEKEVEKKALPCGGRQLGSRLKVRVSVFSSRIGGEACDVIVGREAVIAGEE